MRHATYALMDRLKLIATLLGSSNFIAQCRHALPLIELKLRQWQAWNREEYTPKNDRNVDFIQAASFHQVQG